jgi:hypothetical protein
MKAEHRKELQTNVLADRMGRLVQEVKTGSTTKSAIVWFIAGLALVTLIGWYIATQTGARGGSAWVSFNNSEMSPGALESISQANPGTMAARTARYQRARLLLRSGLNSIYANVGASPAISAQSDAARALVDARRLFNEMTSECSEDPVLQQEAMISAAKAEEALAGVARDGDAKQSVGDLDTAQKLYARLAEKYPETEYGKQAAERSKALADHRAEIADFYDRFREASAQRSRARDNFSP